MPQYLKDHIVRKTVLKLENYNQDHVQRLVL